MTSSGYTSSNCLGKPKKNKVILVGRFEAEAAHYRSCLELAHEQSEIYGVEGPGHTPPDLFGPKSRYRGPTMTLQRVLYILVSHR